MTAYGTFTCLTVAGAFTTSNSHKIKIGTVSYACANSVANDCKWTTDTTPTVTAASLSGNTISFTGTGFPTTGYTAHAIFKSAHFEVVSWTSTTLTASFPNGVPAASASENAVPKIRFSTTINGIVVDLYSGSSNVFLTNSVTASSSSSGLTPSFAGGLTYTISGAGIYASLKEPGNSV